MNPIIIIFSPRDIPIAIQKINEIKGYDKFWIKYYYPVQHACAEANKFIFSHPEYTHIILYIDDLIVEPHHIQTLIDAVEKYNFPVLAGYSNFDNDDMSHLTTICLEPVQIEIKGRTWPVISFDEVKKIKKRFLKVKWNGITIPVIKREVLEKIGGFEDDARLNNLPYATGDSSDVAFCYELNRNKIPIYVDLSVRVQHLRSGSTWQYFYANGKKPPYTLFESG